MTLWIFLFPAVTGFLLIRALAGGSAAACRHDWLRLVLGMGIGIGLVSECYFTALVSGRPVQLFEILLLCAAGTGAVLKCKDARCGFCGMPDRSGGDRLVTQCLSGAFALLLFLDLAVFAWVISRRQRGGWDAWAIWNLRAHFLYRDSAVAWRDAFTETLDWSHPDYPLLVPAFVARGWKSLGRESTAVPIVLAGFFTFGCAGLMAASVGTLRGIRQGLLAALTIAATPSLYVQGAMQCADVPVAFFRLATLAALAMADRFNSRGWAALSGMTAALGGWTKNEGLLWLGAILLARLIVARWRLLPAFIAGALPTLGPVVFFKARVATSSDIFGGAGRAGMMARVLDPTRYSLIAREAFVHAWNFGPLPVGALVMLCIYAAMTGLRGDNKDGTILRTGALALVFTTAGYFIIYLIRPLDLAWLLDTSADRLLLQLWPGIVFVVFMACREPKREPVSSMQLSGPGNRPPCRE